MPSPDPVKTDNNYPQRFLPQLHSQQPPYHNLIILDVITRQDEDFLGRAHGSMRPSYTTRSGGKLLQKS